MPPRNPKSVLYTVKNTISPDKKHTCLEMKSIILSGQIICRLQPDTYKVGENPKKVKFGEAALFVRMKRSQISLLRCEQKISKTVSTHFVIHSFV